MNLRLVLTHHWYDEIASGRKRIEYRETSPYWRKRIWMRRRELATVTFSRGYTSTTQTFAIDHIDTGKCPYPEWYGAYYRIHFKGEVE
jgi:hypothetical protein